jgi:phage terminase large subunit-like protein
LPITLTPVQWDARTLIGAKEVSLLYGGSRSGKTYLAVRSIMLRAVASPGSWHLILRSIHKDCKASIFKKTIPDVIKNEPELFGAFQQNKSDSEWYIDFGNNVISKIICTGLNDDRIESILGNEYATIYFNEASQITYDVYETVGTRLAQKCYYTKPNGKRYALRNKIIVDCNPPGKKHWIYKLFFLKVNPESNEKLADAHLYGVIRLNPKDNIKNIAKGYVKRLQSMSAKKRKRFLHGEFTDDIEGALWKQEWIDNARSKWIIKEKRYHCPDLDKIVVAIDPAVTAKSTSDDTALVVMGAKYHADHADFYLLKAVAGKYRPAQWAKIALNLYDQFEANEIIGEANNGGDLVERNITAERYNAPVKLVRASRGKAIRAEMPASLTENGHVHFVGMFPSLEEELTGWVPDSGDPSPNLLDAFVWGTNGLIDEEGGSVDPLEFSM